MLNREPMGMKPACCISLPISLSRFSAQPRADGDEAALIVLRLQQNQCVSVLNREPMGMKRTRTSKALAVLTRFQCSTASRWG